MKADTITIEESLTLKKSRSANEKLLGKQTVREIKKYCQSFYT